MDLDPEIYKELIETFHGEFDEQVEELSKNLMSLKDKSKNCDQAIDSALRIAHTLRGSSRSIEIENVALIASPMETLFHEIKQGNVRISQELIDTCFDAIDAMKEAMTVFLNGNQQAVNTHPIIDRLGSYL
ncbi:MAG: Hpt domain-containing protein [Gammaproteobacteria bacterium]|nr:Hpt domain-containing protein [Gammaproteobacteria bacterium]MCH9744244.1 Hpt domain-containing protein [Gammaproteobacteria bacterium]